MVFLLLAIGSTELTEFITAVSEGITKGQKQGILELLTPIEFEISVAIKKEGKGGVNITLIEAGGKYEKESVSKIKFAMGNPLSMEQLEKIAKVWQIQTKISSENFESILKLLQK